MGAKRLSVLAMLVGVLAGLDGGRTGACPVDLNISGAALTDGHLSMDSVINGNLAQSNRAADDITFPVGDGTAYRVDRLVAVMACNFVPALGALQIEVFNDGFNGTRVVPGTRRFLKVGATSVVDVGPFPGTPSVRVYRCTFALGVTGPLLTGGLWYWISPSVVVDVNATPGGAGYAATHEPVALGVSLAKNLGYPGAAWEDAGPCCIGPSDLLIECIAHQTGSPISDFTCSGGVTIQDLFNYLAEWFKQGILADFNASGVVTVQDLFDFLKAWFAKA